MMGISEMRIGNPESNYQVRVMSDLSVDHKSLVPLTLIKQRLVLIDCMSSRLHHM